MSIRNIGKQLGWWGSVLVLAAVCASGCGGGQHFAALPPGMAVSSGPGAAAGNAPARAAVEPSPAAPVAAAKPVAVAMTQGGAPAPEVFRAGDSLTIVYSDLPQATPPFQGKIKEDGKVTLLLNTEFVAAGKTAGQLEKEIRGYYVPRFYKYLTVTISPIESTRWYYVYGEVRSPNRNIYNSRITVLQTITSAGGFTDFASKKKVKLTRVNGQTQIINCVKAQGDPKLDAEVYPGDTVYVPRKLW